LLNTGHGREPLPEPLRYKASFVGVDKEAGSLLSHAWLTSGDWLRTGPGFERFHVIIGPTDPACEQNGFRTPERLTLSYQHTTPDVRPPRLSLNEEQLK
jgi:hypothetical protein